MTLLVAGLLIFLGIHSVAIVAPGWRDARQRALGTPLWKGLYSLAAALGLVLIVVGYAAAREQPIPLWTPPAGLRHLSWLLTLPIFVLLIATYLPGRIKRATRHPMLLAVKLWALAHLLVNGTLADLLLFGGFLTWAVADRISLKRRNPSPSPQLPASWVNDAIALVGGLVLWVAFFGFLHRWLIGVAPH